MEAPSIIDRLQLSIDAIVAALRGVDEIESKWRPSAADWSIVEIVNHLADEEVEDFRTRLHLTLEDPQQDWPAIDPGGAAIARRYQDRSLDESLARFRTARHESLNWLGCLKNPDLTQTKTHPKLGGLSAGDLLASWAAHDLLHLRQITKRRHQYLHVQVAPFKIDYAGKW